MSNSIPRSRDTSAYSSLCENCGRTAEEGDMDQPRYVAGYGAYLCGDCEEEMDDRAAAEYAAELHGHSA